MRVGECGVSLAAMRRNLWLVIGLLLAALPVWAKGDKQAKDASAKDPRALLAAAAPYYDFSSPEMKPWHLKATYQLYDEQGKPTEQGTYEFWWASPTVYRSTWTRKSASESDWTTDKGGYVEIGSGDGRNFYEYALGRELLSPFPKADVYSEENARFKTKQVTDGGIDIECVMIVSKKVGYDFIAPIEMGLLPTYCIDLQSKVLLASYSAEGLTANFPQVVRTQEHFLAKHMELMERGHKVLSATVEQVNGIAANDAAFTPSSDEKQIAPPKGAIEAKGDGLNPRVFQVDGETTAKGMLLHRVMPTYPAAARESGAKGTVVLDATIDKDGTVHDVQAVSTPSVLLLESAMFAVSQWTYKPFLLDGKPIQVETKIRVIYSLER